MSELKFTRTVITLVLMIWLQSCYHSNERIRRKIKGHWHMESPYDLTLDITDSIVFVNKYSLLNDSEEFPLFDPKGSLALPIYCGCGGSILSIVKNFSVRNNSLVYDDKISEHCNNHTPIRFIKSDPEKCRKTHAIGKRQEPLDISNLPEQTSSLVNFDSLRQTGFIIPLSIGPPIRHDQWGSDPRILALDAFITTDEIPFYIQQSLSTNTEDIPSALCLVIDASVPKSFLANVIKSIPDSLVTNIYQLVSSEGDIKIGYQLMAAETFQ